MSKSNEKFKNLLFTDLKLLKMIKLKQLGITPYTIVITTLLLFSACRDKSYDLDDDNLDKTGFSVPLGSVNRIILFDELVKQFIGNNDVIFSYDSDGTLFVQYNGIFTINVPTIEAPAIAPLVLDAGVPVQSGMKSLPLPAGQTINIADGNEIYQMDTPQYFGDGWDISFKSIDFTACNIVVTVSFSGITFPVNSPGVLNLSLQFPPNLTLAGNPDNLIETTIDIKNFTDNKYTLPAIKVTNYNYGADTNLQYKVSLATTGSGMVVDTGSDGVGFKMTLTTLDITPSKFMGAVNVTQPIKGDINDFNTFFDSFKEDTLNFYNPSLGIKVETNMGAKFNLNVDLTATNENGSKQNFSGPALTLEKPDPGASKITQYRLSPVNENIPGNMIWQSMKIDDLINYRPYSIDYNFTLNSNDDSAVLFNDMVAKGNYMLKLPFSFTEMNLTVSDTIKNAFTKDFYDTFFKNSEATNYLEVKADSVSINFSRATANSVTLTVNATILKEDGTRLEGVTITPGRLTNGDAGDNPLVIRINGLKNMEEAKHLELSFSANAKALKLTKNDYILIRTGIRLIFH